nr:MAG TPA: hypothetical protein [Caudoviricetes sp.]
MAFKSSRFMVYLPLGLQHCCRVAVRGPLHLSDTGCAV